jgi:hypothetical protein
MFKCLLRRNCLVSIVQVLAEKKRLKHFSRSIQCWTKSCRSRYFEFHIGTKNQKFLEDYPINIHASQEWSLEDPIQSFWFYADRKSKMAATAGHRLTLDLRENIQMPSSQKLQIWLKPNCTWMFIDPMNIRVQFGFNHICSFWEEGIWTFSERVQC